MKVNVLTDGFYATDKEGRSVELPVGEQEVSDSVGKLLLKTGKGEAVQSAKPAQQKQADKK